MAKPPGSVLTSDDVVAVDLGTPTGREAGYRRPAVVVTAQRLLDASPSVLQVVSLTSTLRGFGSEVEIDADPQRPRSFVCRQCQHIRAVASARVEAVTGTARCRIPSKTTVTTQYRRDSRRCSLSNPMSPDPRSRDGTARHNPPRGLGCDRGNEVIVAVIVQDRERMTLGRGGDEQIRDRRSPVSSAGREGRLDLHSSLPNLLRHR